MKISTKYIKGGFRLSDIIAVYPPETCEELKGYIYHHNNTPYPSGKLFILKPNHYNKSNNTWYWMFEKENKDGKRNKRYYFTEDELSLLYAKDKNPNIEELVNKFENCKTNGEAKLVYCRYFMHVGNNRKSEMKDWLIKYPFDDEWVYPLNFSILKSNTGKHSRTAIGYKELYEVNVPTNLKIEDAYGLVNEYLRLKKANENTNPFKAIKLEVLQNEIHYGYYLDDIDIDIEIEKLVDKFNNDCNQIIRNKLSKQYDDIKQELKEKGIVLDSILTTY